ncbi:MAG: glycosyltransferase family 4 protein [Candidatus Hodarchaeota archaeon]
MIAPTLFYSNYGCSIRIFNEAEVLTKLGCRVKICTYCKGYDIGGLDIERIPFTPRFLEPGPSYHRLYLDFLLLLKSFNCASKFKPNIVHVHLHEGSIIGKLPSMLNRAKLVFDAQGSLVDELIRSNYLKKGKAFHHLVSQIEKALTTFADAVITSSSYLAILIRKEFGVKKEKIFVIRDAVNTEVFTPRKKNNILARKLRLPLHKKIVVYLGSLSKSQGVDLLLASVPIVVKKYNNSHFLIMGYPDVEKYRKKSRELGVSRNVTFTGVVDYLNDAASYLALGDVAVAPKLFTSESNGKVLLYMAMGLPTIVFDNPSNRGLLGGLGVYANSEDKFSLAEAIITALSDGDSMYKLGIKLRDRAEREFAPKVLGEKIIEVYDFVKARR